MSRPVLHSYWRSTSSWRVRIVLALKGVDYEYHAVNLLKGEQHAGDYVEVNPMHAIPTLVLPDGRAISESVAINEYLNEVYAEPALLPTDAYDRARCRQLVECVVADIQPIQNMRVLNHVAKLTGDDANKASWAKHYITVGFEGLEKLLRHTAGKYAFGDSITLADCVIVPQVYNANRFGVDMTAYPTIQRVADALRSHPAFADSAPERMPDAVVT